jgi:uncharacterized protein YkwD
MGLRIATSAGVNTLPASLAGVLALTAFACAPPPQSNGAKLGEALAFAAAAGVAQVAESVAEQNARNSAPVTHATYNVSTQCNDQGSYACVTVAPGAGDPPPPPPEMTDADARDYVLGYVNGIRKLNGAPRVERDEDLDTFAEAGSEELSSDHRLGAHWGQHAPELKVRSAEVQGSPDGTAPGPLQDQLASVLLAMTNEGPGGMHHDVLLRREWRKLGVGIVQRAGRTFLTVDLSE